jgi:hypothetical protein
MTLDGALAHPEIGPMLHEFGLCELLEEIPGDPHETWARTAKPVHDAQPGLEPVQFVDVVLHLLCQERIRNNLKEAFGADEIHITVYDNLWLGREAFRALQRSEAQLFKFWSGCSHRLRGPSSAPRRTRRVAGTRARSASRAGPDDLPGHPPPRGGVVDRPFARRCLA